MSTPRVVPQWANGEWEPASWGCLGDACRRGGWWAAEGGKWREDCEPGGVGLVRPIVTKSRTRMAIVSYYFIAQNQRVFFPLRKTEECQSFGATQQHGGVRCRAGVTAEPQGPTGRLPKGRPCAGARTERKVSFGPLSYSWYEQSGQRDCSQISFVGCSQGNALLGFLHVPNRKASIPEASSLTSPRRGSQRPARADKAREDTRFFQAISDPMKSASLQAARVLHVKETKQLRKEGRGAPVGPPGRPWVSKDWGLEVASSS